MMKKSIGFSILLIIAGILFLLDNLDFMNISIRHLIRLIGPYFNMDWSRKLYRDLNKSIYI